MIWSLLWSQRKNALHIEPMETTLSNNRQAYRDNAPGDFRVLVVGTRGEVETAADNVRGTLVRRDDHQSMSAKESQYAA